MNKTTLIMAASASLALVYAAAITHIPNPDSSDTVACGGKDAKKKKSDKKEGDNT